jgi:hypothetical protein
MLTAAARQALVAPMHLALCAHPPCCLRHRSQYKARPALHNGWNAMLRGCTNNPLDVGSNLSPRPPLPALLCGCKLSAGGINQCWSLSAVSTRETDRVG